MRKPKRKARGRKPARKPARTSTALVLRGSSARLAQVLPPEPIALQAPASLASDPVMVTAFVGTFKLTPGQVDALKKPVEDNEVEWRPIEKDGPPIIPYLSHVGYRDRLDAAFGLGGWGMVPTGMPKEKDGVIYVPYALVVEGVPRIYAWGEQAYHANNKQMTYGDALEGAKSNAIVRCGKELGIARELWRRGYLEELKGRMQKENRKASRGGNAPRSYAHGADNRKISDAQRGRLWGIVKTTGRSKEDVKRWLEARYSLESSRDILRRDYDTICTTLESGEPLSMIPAREPGEEG